RPSRPALPFFFSSRRRHTRCLSDWSSDVCSSDLWDLAATVGDKVAALIGAPPGSVSLHQNVTTTQAVITSCFDFSGPRNKVVLVDLEFPSILYFYQEQQARGARIEIVGNTDGIHIPPEKLLAAIDERTLLVPISM